MNIETAVTALMSAGGKVRAHEPLARHTSLRIGGPAELWVEPSDERDLARVLQFCHAREIPVTIIGRGTNLLVRDGGIAGVVIQLAGAEFTKIEVDGEKILARAGARLRSVVMEAKKHNLGGLEFLEGIPGSVGGALRMNAGAMGRQMFEVVERVRYVSLAGEIHETETGALPVQYRSCPLFRDHVALSAELRGTVTSPSVIEETMRTFTERRWATQPNQPSAGCIWKNPAAIPAGKLIDELGLKGLRVGAARVSEAHGNFIINDGNATARDVLELMALIRERARQARGIELETEVMILGGDEENSALDNSARRAGAGIPSIPASTDSSPLHVAVLKGGPSAECEVSMQSGAVVAEALREAGMRVTEVVVHGTEFELPGDVDVVFIALHGTFGEDGQVQQILESRGVPYTGSDVAASARAFDKGSAKAAFVAAGISTPAATTRPPLVVKPARQGSSVGITIVRDDGQLAEAMAQAELYDERIVLEQFIHGRELTVGILDEVALPVVEIRTTRPFFDYQAKYTPGAAEELVPAPLDESTTARAQELARQAHRCLGCRDVSRVDLILNDVGELFVLEVNTIPGMTTNSLLPKAARAAGWSVAEVCARLVASAYARRAEAVTATR